MALNYTALKAHIATIFSKWTATGQKITSADHKDTLDKVVDHLTADGAWDPATTMAQVAALTTTYPNRFSTLATVLYVNQATGNDSNAGTQAAPIATIQRAAIIVNNKFGRALVIIQSDYVLAAHAEFDVQALTIYAEGNFSAQKQTFSEGDGTSYIRNLGGSILFYMQPGKTLTLQAHAGPISPNTSTTYAYRTRQGFLRGPLLDSIYAAGSATLAITVPSLVMGTNTVLFGSYYGSTENGTALGINTHLRFHSASAISLGDGAVICRMQNEFEFRKNILTTTGTWVDVFQGSDEILESGTYAVQLMADTANGAGGSMFLVGWSGVFYWHRTSTNSSPEDSFLIPLTYGGHARNAHVVQLRVLLKTAGFAKLQISSNTLTSPYQFIFKFKKLL